METIRKDKTSLCKWCGSKIRRVDLGDYWLGWWFHEFHVNCDRQPEPSEAGKIQIILDNYDD